MLKTRGKLIDSMSIVEVVKLVKFSASAFYKKDYVALYTLC